MAFVALSNPPLQRLNATPVRANVGSCRDAARWSARLLAAVVRSNATLAFTAERQVVGRTDRSALPSLSCVSLWRLVLGEGGKQPDCGWLQICKTVGARRCE